MLKMDPKSTHFGGPGDTKITKNMQKWPQEQHLKMNIEKYAKTKDFVWFRVPPLPVNLDQQWTGKHTLKHVSKQKGKQPTSTPNSNQPTTNCTYHLPDTTSYYQLLPATTNYYQLLPATTANHDLQTANQAANHDLHMICTPCEIAPWFAVWFAVICNTICSMIIDDFSVSAKQLCARLRERILNSFWIHLHKL